MAPPCYASTEWKGLGHATLRFRPKRESTQPMETHQINCYLSAVYIGEYGEKKKQALKENETREPQSDLKPPGIPPELWTAWEEHWETWKEILIPLSWVHKYRDHCTSEYIEWHDSYLEDYPEVLPLITDELGRAEFSKDTTKQSLENKTCQSSSEIDLTDFYDYIYGEEEEQGNENGSELEETVGGEAEMTLEEHESDKPGRNECNSGARKQSLDNKNSQVIDEHDFVEFYDICNEEAAETSQNCHEGETANNDIAGINLQQECALERIAGVNTASDTTIEEREEKRRKVLDELYEKHTKLRYLVHLRSFLHISGIECDPAIESFYEKKAGMRFMISSSAEPYNSMKKDTENGQSCVVSGGSCSVKGEDQPEEKHTQDRSEPSFKEKENTTQIIHTSNNCNKHKSDSGHVNSLHSKANDNKRKQKQMGKAKQNPEEHSAETPTSKERLQGTSVPQEGGSNSGKEKLNGDSSNEGNKKTDSGGMEVEGASSSGDEGGSVQDVEFVTMNSASASLNTHKAGKRRRKKDTARPQGLSWALKYMQQKEFKQTKEIQGTAETTSMSHEPQEVVPEFPEMSPGSREVVHGSPEISPGSCEVTHGSHEAVSESSKAVPGSPETVPGPTEVAPGSHEVASGSYEAAFESFKAAPGSSEAAHGSHEAAPGLPMPAAGSSEAAPVDAYEDYSVAYFLAEIDEVIKQSQKHHDKMLEVEALFESLQENPSALSQLKAACQATMDKAAAALQELLLPLTAVHLLNLSFPGAAAIEYESSVTEEVPGERKKLKLRFNSFVFDEKERLKHYFTKLGKFCLTMWTDAVVPVSFRHLPNLILQNSSEIEHRFPPVIFGVRWLPEPESSFNVNGKNVKRCQRRFHKWLEVQDPNLSPVATVELRGMVMNRMSSNQDPRKSQQLYQQVVREEKDDSGCSCITLHTLHLLQESSKTGVCGSSEGVEVEWPRVEVTFDQDGYSGIINADLTSQSTEDTKAKAEAEMWQRIISDCRRLTFWETDSTMPSHLPREIQKYWAQRHRLFLKFDEGINLDTESWYSVTPELLAAHQARRCRCEVVVDALCGAGGNAIQLAKTCSHVIAIDKDPNKVHLARHNAEVYGVAHCIDFRVGDFFNLAPSLRADVVYLSPPWGGIEYQEECVYDVYHLGGTMNCARLLRAARAITPNVALYLPRNSNLCQVIALAGVDGVVDIEANYMGPKKKAITAYFGDLATKTGWC